MPDTAPTQDAPPSDDYYVGPTFLVAAVTTQRHQLVDMEANSIRSTGEVPSWAKDPLQLKQVLRIVSGLIEDYAKLQDVMRLLQDQLPQMCDDLHDALDHLSDAETVVSQTEGRVERLLKDHV